MIKYYLILSIFFTGCSNIKFDNELYIDKQNNLPGRYNPRASIWF